MSQTRKAVTANNHTILRPPEAAPYIGLSVSTLAKQRRRRSQVRSSFAARDRLHTGWSRRVARGQALQLDVRVSAADAFLRV